MASGPITSWQIDGEIVERVADFIFGGSKITADAAMKIKTTEIMKLNCFGTLSILPPSVAQLKH